MNLRRVMVKNLKVGAQVNMVSAQPTFYTLVSKKVKGDDVVLRFQSAKGWTSKRIMRPSDSVLVQ